MIEVNVKRKIRRKKLVKKQVVLQDVSFQIKENEVMLVLAPSGAGKTTLFNCILNRTRFKGKVSGNEDIAYVHQEETVDRRETVMEAIYYAGYLSDPYLSEYKAREKAKDIMKELGLSSVSDKKIKNLSGGQRRRVQIGSELARKSSVLLLDEPDSGLDVLTSYHLTSDLRQLAKVSNKSIVVISHNVMSSNLKHYDQILMLGKYDEDTAGIAYLGIPENLFPYFHSRSMIDIYNKLQTKSEGGLQEGEFYINAYQNLSETEKQMLRRHKIKVENERE